MAAEPQRQITVLVADPQPLFLAGVTRAIRHDATLRLVADAADRHRALEEMRRVSPDVAVIDAELDGIWLLQAVAQYRLDTRVVLLSAAVTPDLAVGAVAAGARGYLSKRVGPDMLCDAIHRIAAGDAVLCNDAQTSVTAAVRQRLNGESEILAPRELEVLRLLAGGLSYSEAGWRLHLAPTTVKTYASRSYEKLGAKDRVGAVVEAMRRGILD
jgi:DNA-binding NarL/FixJ family response regulator